MENFRFFSNKKINKICEIKVETKKRKGVKEKFGAEETVNKKLDKIAEQTLFPEKLNEAVKILSQVKFK